MIYLHHCPLTDILSKHTWRINPGDRASIHAYRHEILNQFCLTHQLPTPMYAKDIYNKPYCTNIPQLSFNQSHSHSHYVLIFSLNIPNIGVDTENIHRNTNKLKLTQRYFSPDEYQLWQESDRDDLLWFKIWTTKEAVLKAHGLGIRVSLNELNAHFSNIDSGYISHKKIGKFYFKNIQLNNSVMTVAYPNAHNDIEIKMIY